MNMNLPSNGRGIIREVDLPLYEDPERGGKLVPIEFSGSIPFEVKRSYYLWGVPPNSTRGAHAHLVEEEFFVCLRGKITMKVSTEGEAPQKIVLKDPSRGFYIGQWVWHEFCDFSPDAILLAYSSVNYMPGNDNYIHDFKAFQQMHTDK